MVTTTTVKGREIDLFGFLGQQQEEEEEDCFYDYVGVVKMVSKMVAIFWEFIFKKKFPWKRNIKKVSKV